MDQEENDQCRQTDGGMNNGTLIKTALCVENMPRQRLFEAPPEDWVAGWQQGKSRGSSPSYQAELRLRF